MERTNKKIKRISLTGAGSKRTTQTFKQFVGGFSSWNKIIDAYLHGCNDWYAQAIFLTEFKTMGRAMECASLQRRNFDLEQFKDQIYVKGMNVEKQKEAIYLTDDKGNPLLKNGKQKYTFESIEATRNFYIPKFEPLTKGFIKAIELAENDNDYILTNPYGEPYKYHQMYYKVCGIGVPQNGFGGTGWNKRKGEWWQHRIRSERACELVLDYKYDLFKLMAYGGWRSSEMPLEYIGITPAQLMVTEPPKVWA